MRFKVLRRVPRVFLAVILTFVFAFAAFGDPGAVFTTVTSDYSAGAVGTADLAGTGTVTAPVLSGLKGDLSVFASDLGLFVAEHGSSGTLDTLSLYDGSSWEAPLWNVQVGSVIYDVVHLGNSVYLANYGTNRVTRHSADSGMEQTGMCSLDEDNGEGNEEHVAGLLSLENVLYAIVQSYNTSTFEHLEGFLVSINPESMEITGEVRLGKNPVAMDVWENKLYVACFGGAMGSAGGEPRLYRIDPATMEAELLDDGSALGENYGYSALGIDNEGILFVLSYKNGLTWPEQENRVLAGSLEGVTPLGGSSPLTFQKLGDFKVSWTGGLAAQDVSLTPLETASAWLNAGAVDKEEGLFWVSNRGTGTGDAALEVFSATKKENSFGESQLQSLPYGVVPFSFNAPTPTPVISGGGGSGGCSLEAFSPLAFLLLLPLMAAGRFKGK